VERPQVGRDLADPAVQLAQRVGVRRLPVAAEREDVGLPAEPEMLDSPIGERVDLVDDRLRLPERRAPVQRLGTERTPVGAPAGGPISQMR